VDRTATHASVYAVTLMGRWCADYPSRFPPPAPVCAPRSTTSFGRGVAPAPDAARRAKTLLSHAVRKTLLSHAPVWRRELCRTVCSGRPREGSVGARSDCQHEPGPTGKCLDAALPCCACMYVYVCMLGGSRCGDTSCAERFVVAGWGSLRLCMEGGFAGMCANQRRRCQIAERLSYAMCAV
jgi:hypothetical protein